MNRDTAAGLFVGGNNIKTIKNIGITGDIASTQSSAVGICNYAKIVENCWNKANITSAGNVGMQGAAAGVCNYSPIIRNCYNTGKVIATGRNSRRYIITEL